MSLRAAYWLVFAAMLVVYGAMVLWTLPAISDGAGGLVPFDLRLTGYNVADARLFLSGLNDAGRALYQGPQRLLDTAYPALLGLVLSGAFIALVARRWLRWALILVVLAGMAADYTENYLVAQMLAAQEPVADSLVAAASRATLVKSTLTGLAMTVVLVLLGLAGIAKWRAR